MIRQEPGVIPPLIVSVHDAKRATTSTLWTPAPLTVAVIVPLRVGLDVRWTWQRPATQSTFSA